MPLSDRARSFGVLSVAISGAIWGLLWIPLRGLDEWGFAGAWSSVAFFLPGLVLLLPFAFSRWRRLRANVVKLALTGSLAGAALALYSVGLIWTDVARCILLFYLAPVWSTILARIFLPHQPITPSRAAALVLGLVGLVVILDNGNGLPLPGNPGDWAGLASGITWAAGSLMTYKDTETQPIDRVFAFTLTATLCALGLTLLPYSEHTAVAPTFPGWLPTVGVLLGVVLMVLTMWIVCWAQAFSKPGRVELLLMLEVVVGAASAAVLAGETLSLRAMVGAALIVGAGLIEIFQSEK